jgi:hypothetical protein
VKIVVDALRILCVKTCRDKCSDCKRPMYRPCKKDFCCDLTRGRRIWRGVQISCPMQSRVFGLCACRRLTEDNTEEKSWWT